MRSTGCWTKKGITSPAEIWRTKEKNNNTEDQ